MITGPHHPKKPDAAYLSMRYQEMCARLWKAHGKISASASSLPVDVLVVNRMRVAEAMAGLAFKLATQVATETEVEDGEGLLCPGCWWCEVEAGLQHKEGCPYGQLLELKEKGDEVPGVKRGD